MDIKVKNIEAVMAVIMLTALSILCVGVNRVNAKDSEDTQKFTVVLDAGHGGIDPGKVGVNDAIESEINLEIVYKLKEYLEEHNVNVVLTRVDENGLYSEGDTNKKRSDMERRCEMIEDVKPDMVVSIHQNSYSSKGVKGAQVFYYKNSGPGRKIAAIIQSHLIDEVDPDNGREHKENGNYYLLKNVSCPAVIVECGFLSNSSEAQLLVSDSYQQKLAVAIGNGMLEYLKAN